VLLPPPLQAYPHTITQRRLKIILLKKEGIEGKCPAGCLPLWGRVGVTLLTASEKKRICGKKGFQQSPSFTIAMNDNAPAVV